MPTEEQAVHLLGELGLTEYEARCFVALSRVSTATAAEVASLSEVPRSRVYDAVDRLHRRGLVDVQQSEPREYRAISTDAALSSLREEHQETLEATDNALSQLRRSDDLEEEGAWAIAEHDHVSDRIESFLERASDEVYVLVVDDAVLDRAELAQFEAVADRGVDVLIEVADEAVEATISDAAPSASVAVTDLAGDPTTLENKRLGQIVMVDRRAVLISAVSEMARPGQTKETAIWASGPDHGLVVGLRHVFGVRIDSGTVFEDDPFD